MTLYNSRDLWNMSSNELPLTLNIATDPYMQWILRHCVWWNPILFQGSSQVFLFLPLTCGCWNFDTHIPKKLFIFRHCWWQDLAIHEKKLYSSSGFLLLVEVFLFLGFDIATTWVGRASMFGIDLAFKKIIPSSTSHIVFKAWKGYWWG